MRLNLKRRHLWVTYLLRQAFPHRADRLLTSYDAGAWRECRSVIGIKRRDADEITLVEKIDPLRIYSLDLRFLRKCWRNQCSNKSDCQ